MLLAARATTHGGQAELVTAGRVSVDTASLRRTLDSLAMARYGTVGYAVVDLHGGARLPRRIRRVWDKMEALGLVDQRWAIDTERQVTMARMGEAIVKAGGATAGP